MRNNNIKRLATCGVLLGASFVLSFIKIFHLPFGGSITLCSMVPVLLAGVFFGTKWGFFTSGAYALLQLLQGFMTSDSFVLPEVWQTILMIALDYLLAFLVLGFGGIFVRHDGEPQNLSLRAAAGAVVAVLLRYIMHIISGAILYGMYADWFFGEAFQSKLSTWALASLTGSSLSWFYSIVYNGFTMIPEMIISAVVVAVLLKIPAIRKHLMKF